MGIRMKKLLPSHPWSNGRGSILLFLTLALAFLFVACGDDDSSSFVEPEKESSSSEILSSSDGTSDGNGDKSSSSVSSSSTNSSSSAKSSSSTDSKSSGGESSPASSSVKSSSSGTSSSSVWTKPCSSEGSILDRTDRESGKKLEYICKDGFYVLYVRSSSSSVPTSSYFNMDSLYNSKYSYGEFVDPRDGQKYRILDTKFGYDGFENMTVFATNLNYGKQIPLNTTVFDDNAPEKYCYDDDPWYCDNGFGGLYSWSEAMGLPKACDSVWTGTTPACPDSIFPGREYDHEWDRLKIQGICPEGWHVMNRQEWGALKGASEDDYGFVSKVNGGSNSQGFSALYGGIALAITGEYQYIRVYGRYRLPFESSATNVTSISLGSAARGISRVDLKMNSDKPNGLSVRCVKNR